jgi:diguanylate cyclase (GGDEF)-like protein
VLAIDYTTGLELSIYTIGLVDAAIIFAGVISMRRGNKRARLFLIGWSVFVCGAMITALTDSGFLPLLSWTNYASQLGSAFEAVVLSWMLAGQISSIKREKELAVEQMKETRRLADSDDLTGLFNRRYIVQAFQALAYRSNARDLSIMVLDVDHFKVFNDTYGHDVGDEVLRQLAKTMQDCFRPSDIVGRYGGEEFIVLLPGTNVDQARSAAEYFQQTLRSYPFAIGGHTFACTVSIGISEWNGIADDDFERIFRRADEALYEAKRAGRNRICTNVVRPSAWRKEEAQ